MAVNFPATPAPNQVVTDPATNAAWRWDAPSQRWVPAATGAVFATQDWVKAQLGAPTHTGPTAPSPPNAVGDLWLNTNDNSLYVYDGSGWIPSAPPTTGFLPVTGGSLSGLLTIPPGQWLTGTGGNLSNVTLANCDADWGLIYGALTTNRVGLGWTGAESVNLYVDQIHAGGLVMTSTASMGALTGITRIGLDSSPALIAYYVGGSAFVGMTYSDRRLKSEVKPTTLDALGTINRIALYETDLKIPINGANQHYDCSLIADELDDVIPNARLKATGEEGSYDSINTYPIVCTLMRAVQQLTVRVEALEAQLRRQ